MEEEYPLDAIRDLAKLEKRFQKEEMEILRFQCQRLDSLYTERSKIIRKIKDFWSIVFEQSDETLDNWISQGDSLILKDLVDLRVFRPLGPKDDPRALRIEFEFSENIFFSNLKLVKEFTPVDSLNHAELESKSNNNNHDSNDEYEGSLNQKFKSKPVNIDWKLQESELYLEDKSPRFNFFMTWFAWENNSDNSSDEDNDDIDDAESLDSLDEEDAGTLATILAEDIYPNAVNYFTQAVASSDEDDSDGDGDSDSDLDDDDEDEDEGITLNSREARNTAKDEKMDETSEPNQKRQRSS